MNVRTRTIEVDEHSADVAELDRQWAAIEAGEPTVPHDEVARWLETRWPKIRGTPAFKPWRDRDVR